MPKATTKAPGLRPTKEVSVMAWIEDSAKGVLLVRQAAGLKLWTLPGGKVKRGESLVKALKREVREEPGLRVQIGSLLGVLDRRDKDAITLLFAAVPSKPPGKVKQKQKEIQKAGFQMSLPKKASPSARHFWSARRGPVKKASKTQSRAAANFWEGGRPLGRVGHAREERGEESPSAGESRPPVPGRAHGMESLLRNHTISRGA
jgi:ADP-ribose pyrophosphatase YjhB (NUDIX family)